MKSVLLSQDNIKPLNIKFNGGDISSDAGILLLK